MHLLGKRRDSIYAKGDIAGRHSSIGTLKLADIFKEGSEARRLFGKFYALGAIVVILTVLALLALATRGV